jgi:multidrug transporter EmrE-like cation transporter
MQTVFLYAGLSALCFSVFNAIVKALPARIHLIYVLPFVVIGGLVIALLGLLLPRFVPYEHVILTRTGAFYALGMGAVWAIGQLVFLHMFFKYPELSVVTPIMVGCVAVGGTLAGFFIFKEPISVGKVIGVVGIMLSVYILSKG